MKKLLTLLLGLLIAFTAGYALPKETEKIPLKVIIKFEAKHEAVATITYDIQMDVGVLTATDVEIKNEGIAVKPNYIVADEGKAQKGYRRMYNPASNKLITTQKKGPFDKNRCLESRLSMRRSSPPDSASSGLILLIE